jgi:hypothetical protein
VDNDPLRANDLDPEGHRQRVENKLFEIVAGDDQEPAFKLQ